MGDELICQVPSLDWKCGEFTSLLILNLQALVQARRMQGWFQQRRKKQLEKVSKAIFYFFSAIVAPLVSITNYLARVLLCSPRV